MKSFDFYDTLFVRLLGEPRGIFQLIEKLLDWPGFTQRRIDAEASANIHSPKTEVTLDDIYALLDADAGLSTKAKQLELELETQLLAPVKKNVRKLGPDDLVISDMYLPRSVLQSALDANVKTGCNLRIILSSERGDRKSDGTLWRNLIRDNIKPESHLGDHLVSDVKRPRQAGIPATHFRDSLLNRFEKRYLKYGLDGSLIAGVSRAARLSEPEGSATVGPNAEKLVDVFASVIAPLLVSFVEHVLADSVRRGIRNIFFLARDGQLLYKIANLLIAHRDINVKAHYIFGSRQALHMAGYKSPSQAMAWLFENTTHLSINEIAARANLPPEVFKKAAQSLGLFDLSANISSAQRHNLAALFGCAEVVTAMEAESERQWVRAIAYFRDAGLAPGATVALVDVGWSGRMQASLRSILDKDHAEGTSVIGHYLCLATKIKISELDELYGFLHDPSRFPGPCIYNSFRPMIESALSADHGSTTGFEFVSGKPQPIFSAPPPPQLIAMVQLQQHTVLNFVSLLLQAEAITGFAVTWPNQVIQKNLLLFLKRPQKMEALAFTSHVLDVEQVEIQLARLIVPGYSVACLFDSTRLSLWPEGSAAAEGRWGTLFLIPLARWARRTMRALI
jgi:predicted HAD superfamily hydrolase